MYLGVARREYRRDDLNGGVRRAYDGDRLRLLLRL